MYQVSLDLLCVPVVYDEKNIFFLVLVLEGLGGFHQTIQLQLLGIGGWGVSGGEPRNKVWGYLGAARGPAGQDHSWQEGWQGKSESRVGEAQRASFCARPDGRGDRKSVV